MLSTAEIDKRVELPQLQSRRIGRVEQLQKSWYPPPMDTQKLFVDYDYAKRVYEESMTLKKVSAQKKSKREKHPPEPLLIPQSLEDEDIDSSMLECRQDSPLQPRYAPPRQQDLSAMFSLPSMGRPSSAKVEQSQSVKQSTGVKKRNKKSVPIQKFVEESSYDYENFRLAGTHELNRGKLIMHSRAFLLKWEFQQRYISIEPQQSDIRIPELPSGYKKPAVSHRFDYVYRTDSLKNILAQDRFRKITLMEQAVDVELVYVSVPSKSQQVFRQVRLKNPLQAPLLAGPVDVYHHKSFLMQSHFQDIPSKGAFHFDLGVESNIRISRKLQSKEQIEGMFIKEKEIFNTVTIEAKNLLKKTIDIELLEMLPTVDEDEKSIKVQVDSPMPVWNKTFKKDAPEGARGWTTQLPSQETKTFSYSYKITIPTDQEL